MSNIFNIMVKKLVIIFYGTDGHNICTRFYIYCFREIEDAKKKMMIKR